ncbi:zinc carboxypeptidase [Tenacibaculum holothuriorum]|uniref:Zinc carboxypeptidase n=1 Tax=Tenacibaculum holothuriorum TaxID=1635173 RepID=A0A1Y2PFV0_9FLAO|nr:M14 family metallopeptidase [Tenacibaculum holothuriorum]OSY88599.1 zinc carboxypeptidase [Tenacibaculum holothuriorum]
MKYKLLLLFLTINITLFAQKIKSPEEFLGYKLGERFTRHHKVIDYFNYVSKNLNNVILEKYGETNEHRPLNVAFVSSQKNIDNLEQIRQNNLAQAGISNNIKKDNNIAIVWLSYNVHGNEASSTEAAMQTLYELVTNKKSYLENTLVIIDPAVNPDGRDRYVNWYNQVSSSPYNTNQEAKEHRDPWPTGRPNHYLFDLNRDWAWATQVETQQRLKVYNKWLPHIHVDFHEQYINNPYYFAPAAEPFHEIISDWQRDFQTQIGKNHAKHFDRNNWLYFTKESFDLLYPSYGDTYPTFMGAIGMTYEQAGHGMAGLGIDTDHGYELTLVDRVKHHNTTGLSTIEIASKNAEKLNSEFKKFFENKNLTYKSYVLKNTNDDKINRLTELLDKHEIAYNYAKPAKVSGFDYTTSKKGSMQTTAKDLVIHTDQPKGKMVKALFEPNTKLADSLTYDITAWALPYAHGLKAIASKNKIASEKKNKIQKKNNTVSPSSYAYISKWNSLEDATFLAELLQKNIKVRFSEKPFSVGGKSYKRGSLIILRHDNKTVKDFDAKLIAIANDNNREINPVNTGFVSSGVDFGSYSVKPINKQKVAVLSGKGTSSLSFGEIWHFFEQQLKYPITILDSERLGQINLNNYDVLIIPNGYYGSILNKGALTKIKKWISSGGTTVVIGNALRSFADKKQFALKTKKGDTTKVKKANLTPYAQLERESTNNLITGAIFKSKVDATHPLAFGYDDTYFSLKLGNTSYNYLKKGGNVAYFTKDAKNISGFAGKKALKNIPKSLLFGEEQIGRGSIIYMVDNPLFRSFWENGKLFFANAVFFRNSSVIKK